MRTTITALALTLALASPAAACTEDMACWNWATMGNHKRGVVTVFGQHKVVGVCEYQRLVKTHGLSPTNKRMLGDATAMAARC